MKFLTQVFTLVIASLAVVAAQVTPDEDLTPCKTCTSPDCTTELYPHNVTLKDISGSAQFFRTFTTPVKGDDNPDLTAVFSYEGGTHTLPPSGLVTSVYEDKVILTVDMEFKSYKAVNKESFSLLIDPDSSCSTGFPRDWFPNNIKKVTVSEETS